MFSSTMVNRIYSLILALSVCALANAQTGSGNRISFIGGIDTNDAFDLEFTYHYYPCRYVGLGGGIGYYRQFDCDAYPQGDVAGGKYTSWIIDEGDTRAEHAYLRPSVRLSSPSMMKGNSWAMNAVLEPGLQLLIPFASVSIDYDNSLTYARDSKIVSTTKGDWMYWNVRAGLEVTVNGNLSIELGYGISNLDIYSARRKMTVENVSLSTFYPPKELTQTYYLSLSYRF